MSDLGTAIILNAVVLAIVLEADLGRHRKVTWFRVGRPIVTAAAIVPVYFQGFAHHGTGLLLEVAATIAGVLLGLVAAKLLTRTVSLGLRAGQLPPAVTTASVPSQPVRA